MSLRTQLKYKIGHTTVDLNLLTALNALLEEGSITKAAQRMNLSAPATSRILSQIREAFSDPMLVRSGRHLVTIPRAEQLRAPVQQWVAQAETLFQASDALDISTYKSSFTLYANDVFSKCLCTHFYSNDPARSSTCCTEMLTRTARRVHFEPLRRGSAVYWFDASA